MVRFVGVIGGETGGSCGGGEEGKGPFPAEAEDAEEQVYGLEEWDRADAVVEVGGQEVPEYFRPEEAEYGGCDLICEGSC